MDSAPRGRLNTPMLPRGFDLKAGNMPWVRVDEDNPIFEGIMPKLEANARYATSPKGR